MAQNEVKTWVAKQELLDESTVKLIVSARGLDWDENFQSLTTEPDIEIKRVIPSPMLQLVEIWVDSKGRIPAVNDEITLYFESRRQRSLLGGMSPC